MTQDYPGPSRSNDSSAGKRENTIARRVAEENRPPVKAGDLVGVYVFGRWRQGLVLRVGRTRAFVHYTTPTGAKRRREAWFALADLRRRHE